MTRKELIERAEFMGVDVLDATKELPRRRYTKSHRKYGNHEAKIKIFGITIGRGSWSDDSWQSTAQAGIRFGHIKTLEVIDDDAVLLTLKSGQEVELSEGSTDIGTDIREIIVEDEHEGEIHRHREGEDIALVAEGGLFHRSLPRTATPPLERAPSPNIISDNRCERSHKFRTEARLGQNAAPG